MDGIEAVKKTVLFLAALAVVPIWWGCATPVFYTHTVKWRTESLSIIAGWYTGDMKNWKTISEANPDVNPSPIPEGTRIRIPENIVKTKSPLTRDYVDSFYEKPKKEQAPKEVPQIRDERLDFFGPRRFPRK
jgi:hypothetical protein